jgi:hypothetical protein
MAKTYPLKALWPLLPFEVAAAPLLATLDAYGGGLVKYAVSQDGIWLFSPAQPLNVQESENLTGFHPADLVPKQIDGVEGYFYAMQGGAPLLPLPFTKDQLIAFEKRMAGLIASCVERGDETDAWIANLEKDNPDAAELARGIHGNKWPFDLADIVDTKTDGAAKPRFRLADGIEANASTMAFKSAFDEAQRQKDMLKSMGITTDLLKQMDYQKDMEKLLGNSASSLADAVYLKDLQRNQDMLRAISPSASEMAAEALGRQFVSTVGIDTAASAYLKSQSLQQTELERITAMAVGSVANCTGQLDLAGLDGVMGRYHQPTAIETFQQMERERMESAFTNAANREPIIEFTPLPFFDHQDAINRQRENNRKHDIETARLEEIARQEVREEYEARKQAAPAAPAKTVPAKRQTWRDVALAYVVDVYKAGQYATTKDFYKALLGKAGTANSPFQKGTGANSGDLFVQVISKPLSLKTLENTMTEIRQAAK